MEQALNPTWNYISECGFPLLINVVFFYGIEEMDHKMERVMLNCQQ